MPADSFIAKTVGLFARSKVTPLIIMFAVVTGAISVLNLPREEEPQINVPMADIFVSYPGASAEEVENLILMHAVVQNVACVPMPDEKMGEKMCAFVILKKGHDLNLGELSAFLMSKEIAKFKFPERLEVLPDFPVSTFGKVSKKALGEWITQKIETEHAARSTASH